jgi:hypothetical protein
MWLFAQRYGHREPPWPRPAPRAARQRPGFELDTDAAAATVQRLVEMSDPREEAPVSRRSLVSSG